MLTKQEVQEKLDTIGYNRSFTITFIKKDGTERVLHGWMEPPVAGQAKVESAVAMREKDTGEWKAFRLDSVISIV